jgi:hypothetical protein
VYEDANDRKAHFFFDADTCQRSLGKREEDDALKKREDEEGDELGGGESAAAQFNLRCMGNGIVTEIESLPRRQKQTKNRHGKTFLQFACAPRSKRPRRPKLCKCKNGRQAISGEYRQTFVSKGKSGEAK